MPLKLEPKKVEAHRLISEAYGLRGYPTIVFTDAAGRELDRFLGYRGPDELLAEIARIRSGDTFVACLDRLDADPASLADLERVVGGFLDRDDPGAALERIDAYRAALPEGEGDGSGRLALRAMTQQHGWAYRRAGRAYKNGWEEPPDLSASRATPALLALLEGGLAGLSEDEQAEALRRARHDDAGLILTEVPADDIPAGDLVELADFADTNGHYELAGDLFRRWYEQAGENASVDALNGAAWTLYLSRQDLDLAVVMARQAYAGDSSPMVADTLGRLLYVAGRVDEAIEVQSRAAAGAEGFEAEDYEAVVQAMRAREELDDRPQFESYPG